MKNIEEAPQHEMAAHATGKHRGGAENWEINYVPYNGNDASFTIGKVKPTNKGGVINNQGGAENLSGVVEGMKSGGRGDAKLSANTVVAGQEGLEKWRSSYVPFSPPSSFPWKTIEDESSSKGFGGNGGDGGEVLTLANSLLF